MSRSKGLVHLLTIVTATYLVGCSSAPVNTPSSEASLMRHNIRELVSYDSVRMIRLVDREIDMKEPDDEVFMSNAANVLAQTVMVQPSFDAREAAIKQLRSKLENEEYIDVVERAVDRLLLIAGSGNAADQASAFVALDNLVAEIRVLKRPELKPSVERIASANLEPSREAKRYSRDTLKRIISPSVEAQAVLKTLSEQQAPKKTS